MSRSPNRMHEREYFYKYMSAESARRVLENTALKWTAPIEFNDPFDVPRELAVGLSPIDLRRAAGKGFIDVLRNLPDDTTTLAPNIKFIVDTLKSQNASKVDIQELIAEAEKEIKEIADGSPPRSETLEALRFMWRTAVADMRIICLCESHEAVSMWYHYADAYRGAVIELHCVDEVDSPLLLAKPVQYSVDIPGIGTRAGWSKLLVMNPALAIRTMLETSAYMKTPDWSYEREWRVVSFKRPTDQGTSSFYRMHPIELRSLFLGPLMTPDNKTHLIALARSSFTHIRIFQTEIALDRRLIFHEVSTA